MALTELILATLWLLAPPPILAEPPALQALPLSTLRPLGERLTLVWHQRQDWAMAFYLPPQSRPQGVWTGDLAAGTGLAVGHDAEAEYLALLAVPAPRLVLHAPYYRSDGERLRLGELAVDSSEYLFKALFDAYFDLELEAADLEVLRSNADQRFPDLPAERRLDAYLDALGDFGAHLLSLANEIRRSFTRHADASGLCRLASPPRGLFSLWKTAFTDAAFQARIRLPPTSDSPGGWRTSAHVLERSDKAWLVERVLEGAWSGEPERDFASYCGG